MHYVCRLCATCLCILSRHQRGASRAGPVMLSSDVVFFIFLKSQLILTMDLGITWPDQKIHFAQLGKVFSDKFLFLLKVIIQVLKK